MSAAWGVKNRKPTLPAEAGVRATGATRAGTAAARRWRQLCLVREV